MVIKVIIAISRVVFSWSEKVYLTWFQKKFVLIYILVLSLMMFLLVNVPIFTKYVEAKYNVEQDRCMFVESGRLTEYAVYVSLIVFFMPNLVNVLCYTAVHVHVQKITDVHLHEKDLNSIKVSTILIWVNFTICWVPFIVFNIIDPGNQILPVPMHLVGFYSFLANFALDPFLYAFRTKEFKTQIRALCLPRKDSAQGSEDLCDYNDLGEEYNNNLDEMLQHMKETDLSGIIGIRKKQQIQKAKQQMQLSVISILQDHCKKKEMQESINRNRSQSDKKGKKEAQEQWKRLFSIVRVRDIMNLNAENVMVPSSRAGGVHTQISM